MRLMPESAARRRRSRPREHRMCPAKVSGKDTLYCNRFDSFVYRDFLVRCKLASPICSSGQRL